MKKIIPVLLVLPIMLSCMLYSTPPLGETNFPLQQVASIPIGGDIEDIAVGETWIAVSTYDNIAAIDLDTQKELWKLDIQVSKFGEGFQMVNEILVTASEEKIILIDKQRNKREIVLDTDVRTITRILGVYSDYLYVVGGPGWVLEAYDLSQNRILWKMQVGRSIGKVYYDPSNDVAYVTSDDFVRGFDNSSGKLLWEMGEVYGQGTLYESGILYVSVPTNVENAFRLAAIDGASQETLWEKDIHHSSDIKVSSSAVIDNLLIYRGYGMIAVDKSNGDLVWVTPSEGEELRNVPVEFNDVIYVKGIATGAVYAISFDDGTILGYARLEDIGLDGVSSRIFALKDGIVFSTRNEIVVYKAKRLSLCGSWRPT